MERTPDWSILRITKNPALFKPLIALETGFSQKLLASSTRSGTAAPRKKESLRERAEAWLSASYGVTKAVVLVDVKECMTGPDDDDAEDEDQEAEDPPLTPGIRVVVELWRNVADDQAAIAPRAVEHHEFTVSHDSEPWDADEVPAGFPTGITFYPTDVYEVPTPHARSFLLPLFMLRNATLDTLEIHEHLVGKRRRGRG